MHNLMTLEDLANYCASNNLFSFSAKDSNSSIYVSAPCVFEKDDESSNDTMLFCNAKLLHTNSNRNTSNVTKLAAEKCMPNIKYKPLLANFCEIDGVRDFTSHDMEVTEDGINYIEKQIGCFTADEPTLEYNEEKDRYYINAKVAIPREYTDAAEIIERKSGTKISAELRVNEMSYDAQKKELILTDIEVLGATCLGKNPETGEDVQEGMEGARLDIADFNSSSAITERFSATDEKIIEMLESIQTTLSSFNVLPEDSGVNSKKGGKDNVKFDELLEKYGKTVEDVTFEYEGMTDEELELAFEEAFKVEEEEEVTEEFANEEDEPEAVVDEEAEDIDEDEKACYSISYNGDVKTYSVSLNETIYALQMLVNDTYSESDCDWYSVDVYSDEKYVVMHGYQKSYRQSYKAKKDVFSLIGDRVEVFARFLTEDEISALDNMKTNYASISDELRKYKDEPEKINILKSEAYSKVFDTDEFTQLFEKEGHFDLSIDEVEKAADGILLKYAKSGNISFSSESDKEHVGRKTFMSTKKVKGRYGDLFSK